MEQDKQTLNNLRERKKQVRSPFDVFFSMGNKITKGDPLKKTNFDYYLLWIMFVAFFSILVSNFISFVNLVQTNWVLSLKYLGWVGVIGAILWFQYGSLNGVYHMRKNLQKSMSFQDNPQQNKELKIESVEEMMKEFQDEDNKMGGNKR